MKIVFVLALLTVLSVAEISSYHRVDPFTKSRALNLYAEFWYQADRCMEKDSNEQLSCVERYMNETVSDDIIYINPNPINTGSVMGRANLTLFFRGVTSFIKHRVQVLGPAFFCKDRWNDIIWMFHEEFVTAESSIYPKYIGLNDTLTSTEENAKYYGFRYVRGRLWIVAIVQPDSGAASIRVPVQINGKEYQVWKQAIEWDNYLDFDFYSCKFPIYEQVVSTK